MKVLEQEQLITEIKKSNNILITGFSAKVQRWINEYNLSKNIVAILDNDTTKWERVFEGIKIIGEKDLKNSYKAVIPLSIYMNEFYIQLKRNEIEPYIVEYDESCYEKFFGKKFKFSIELCDYRSKFTPDTVHFHIAPAIFKYLVWYNLPINVITTKHNNDEYFKKRKLTPYQFCFSYHSVGKAMKNILRYKEGYFHDIVFFDNKGFGGFANKIFKKDVNKVSKTKAIKDFDFFIKNYTAKNLSKYIQANLDEKLPENYVFFAMQTTNDAVMELKYFEPIYLINKLAQITKQQKMNLVIKRHPKCNDKKVEKMLENLKLQSHIFISKDSIHHLIKNAKCVLTINSGVGFEALMHLKPVILFGKADYESCCVICKDLSKLDFNQTLSKEKILYIKKFISYFMQERNFNINDEEKIRKIIYNILKKYFEKLLRRDFNE